MAIYKGFSTLSGNSKFRLTDFALVKQDLRNQLFTRKGERVMNPNFGCGIWDLLFEPLTLSTKDSITSELLAIVKADPRLAAEQIVITEYQNGLMIQFDLRMLTTNQVETMYVNFQNPAA